MLVPRLLVVIQFKPGLELWMHDNLARLFQGLDKKEYPPSFSGWKCSDAAPRPERRLGGCRRRDPRGAVGQPPRGRVLSGTKGRWSLQSRFPAVPLRYNVEEVQVIPVWRLVR